jgi:hypothetical protein
MLATILDAKAKLEAEGLRVSRSGDHSLWIAATLRDAGDGITLSDDACALLGNAGRWVAVFPAEGLSTYEVPGSLADLVSLIVTVYARYRQVGGPVQEAFKQAVSQPEQYRTGRSPAASNGALGRTAEAKGEEARTTH